MKYSDDTNNNNEWWSNYQKRRAMHLTAAKEAQRQQKVDHLLRVMDKMKSPDYWTDERKKEREADLNKYTRKK